MRVAILGFGLIGGSVARALAAAPDAEAWSVAAWSPGGVGPAQAAAEGVIALATRWPEDALDGADLVLLAAPPIETLDLLDALAGRWADHVAPHAVVTDVASTKVRLMERADELGLRFVGGHPMAGRETTGYAASRADLFRGRPWVVVPGGHADPGSVIAVETLAVACGARPVRLGAREHDEAVAGISHLPLVLAAALVEAVAGDGSTDRPGWPLARSLAAGGWRDMTRLARGDVSMGAGIGATNAKALAERLRDVRAVLDAWLADLEGPDGPDVDALADRLRAARERLEEEP
jgi:prephenate dehydrogenase